ncbi:MAG: hypothetical protein ACKVP3_02720 [Hyphomicrobiaceae bacterium]
MLRRRIPLLLGAVLCLSPAAAEAQVYEFIKVCKRTVSIQIACIIAEKGIEKVLEKGADEWLAYYRETNKMQAPPPPPGMARPPRTGEVDELKKGGADWGRLMRSLDRAVGTKPLDANGMEAILRASCATRVSFICGQFGMAQARDGLERNCGSFKTQEDCEDRMLCTWRGSECARASTKDLLSR